MSDDKNEFEIIRFKVPARFAAFCETFGIMHPKYQAQGIPTKHAAIAAVGVALCELTQDKLPDDVTANELARFAKKLIETFVDLENDKPNTNIKTVVFDGVDFDNITPKGEA